MVAVMVPESKAEEVTEKESEVARDEQIVGGRAEQDKRESMEENLEKLAALNLGNDPSLQPRFSTAILRLVSAFAGIGALVLIYFIAKLFVL
jgi:hypothetical protein